MFQYFLHARDVVCSCVRDPFDAALEFDLPSVQKAASALPVSQLCRTDSYHGATIVHGLATHFFFFKAGEISGLVPWPNASKTVYAQDVKEHP